MGKKNNYGTTKKIFICGKTVSITKNHNIKIFEKFLISAGNIHKLCFSEITIKCQSTRTTHSKTFRKKIKNSRLKLGINQSLPTRYY